MDLHTENRIDIFGPPDRIFDIAADIARWPRWLPHYRWVKIYSEDGRTRAAEMAALRNRFPCKWRAVQALYPEERRITYHHTGGITRGMGVEWRIVPAKDRTHVTITHDLRYPVPVLGSLFARFIVGDIFVRHIADRTLLHLKRRVEAEVK